MTVRQLIILWITGLTISGLYAQTMRTHMEPGIGTYGKPFQTEESYRREAMSPLEFLGFPLGSRPVRYSEVQEYFRYLSESFPNAQLHSYGQTYEGRELIYLVVSSPENMENLDAIRSNIAKLADPRNIKRSDNTSRIISSSPAIAWMAYAIHGDELSSTDAAVQMAYQLLDGNDDATLNIMNNLVVCIDPLQNPDGRERILSQLQQWNGVVPNSDIQSLSHTGVWPWGRGNHYLFDLNRDWLATVHPETRGKVKAILEWQPQLVVDAHEMGGFDTYLFNPPRAPFNPFLPGTLKKWWGRLANDQAQAFDEHGWSYYTRDWNEEFYPGYGSSWGIYAGLIGILYEQSGTDGSQVKRPDGTIQTYREAVHHQLTSSLANLKTIADNRKDVLKDYYEYRRKAVTKTGPTEAFIFPSSSNNSRLNRFIATLQRQTFEVQALTQKVVIPEMISSMGDVVKRKTFPAGTYIVYLNQPLKSLLKNSLQFDVRMDTKSLEKERRKLLKHGESTLYDVSAWSLPLAYGIESYYTSALPNVKTKPATIQAKKGVLKNAGANYGYVLSGSDDTIYRALSLLFEKEIKLWCAEKAFIVEGGEYSPGSIVIRNEANPELDVAFLETVARESGLTITGVHTALASKGPDLGGNDFTLLESSRIAIVSGPPTSTYSFGSIWHLLDSRLNTRVSLLNMSGLSRSDLNKYNVIVLPAVYGGVEVLKDILGKSGINKISAWVEDGGTLIATGRSAVFLADTSVAISAVRLRRQSLEKLEAYEYDLDRLKKAEVVTLDSLDLWENTSEEPKTKDTPDKTKEPAEDVKAKDELARTLSPKGAILGLDLDPEHWLSFGCGETVPVLYRSSYVFMAKRPVQVPARLSDREHLRLSGLLWPEARERISESAWATRESKGRGQIILFATQPNFRAFFHGSERLLLNALFLGPGMGTRRTVDW